MEFGRSSVSGLSFVRRTSKELKSDVGLEVNGAVSESPLSEDSLPKELRDLESSPSAANQNTPPCIKTARLVQRSSLISAYLCLSSTLNHLAHQ